MRLARCRDVRYELRPVKTVVAVQRLSAGYELALFGVNDGHGAEEAFGCPSCGAALRDLRRIASWVLRAGDGAGRAERGPHVASWYEAPGRAGRPEVALQIRMAPAGVPGTPLDESLEELLREVEVRLALLGVFRERER